MKGAIVSEKSCAGQEHIRHPFEGVALFVPVGTYGLKRDQNRTETGLELVLNWIITDPQLEYIQD